MDEPSGGTGAVRPDLVLLACKGKGAHFTGWARLHPANTERALAAAHELGFRSEYLTRVGVNALALVCLSWGVTLDTITLANLDAVGDRIENSPLIPNGTRKHLRAEHQGLRKVCYQLGAVDVPPRHANIREHSIDERVADIPQPQIRQAVARYLRLTASTVSAETVEGRAFTLRLFAQWLAPTHPDVTMLSQLTRAHPEHVITFDVARLSRGRAHQGRTVSTRHHRRTLLDLRLFLDDLAAWGWADAPAGRLLHRGDLPRVPAPLPRQLSPDIDAALMRAVSILADHAARCGILLLRGAGLRLGELLDLELACLWDLPGHGTWLKVPLGKLDTERVLPLDDTTLATLDVASDLRPPSLAAAPRAAAGL